MSNSVPVKSRRFHPVRVAGWGFAAFLLVLPAAAMQFTREVQWTPFDFIVMAAMIGGTGLLIEVAARMSSHWAYRTAAVLALVASFLIIWVNLAVGIIGNEDNPLNTMFAGVLAVAAAGTLIAKFRAAGMRWTMVATAISQGIVAAVAATQGHNIVPITAALCLVWLIAAGLFGRATNNQ